MKPVGDLLGDQRGVAPGAVVDNQVKLDLMRRAVLTVLPDPPGIPVAGRTDLDTFGEGSK